MGDLKHYVIRGGLQGRERLKILARVMHKTTAALFDRVGVGAGMKCLDVGCGSGDVTMDLARRVGSTGMAVGADIDETKLQLAREEAEKLGVENVEFRSIDIRDRPEIPEFDVVYARFLLTHLSDPASAVDCFYHLLRPGGVVILEDIDSSAHFVYPPSKAVDRFVYLYCSAVERRGGDPNIGSRLPFLLQQCGFRDVDLTVVQPMGLEGEVKLINPLTMENIAEAAIEEGLTTSDEVAELVQALYDYAAVPTTLAGVPRVVQAWGWRPA